MNRFGKVTSCVAGLAFAAPLAHGVSFLDQLYGTGLDASGAKLSTSTMTADAHYSLASLPEGFNVAYAVEGYLGYWKSSTEDYMAPTGKAYASQWISPLWNGGQAGEVNNYPDNQQFNYTLAFNLGNLKNAEITGQWMADNGTNGAGLISQILVNGVATGQQIVFNGDQFEPFNNWHGFDLKGDYFKEGENTITFSVTNWPQSYGNPTGLRVAFTSADAQSGPPPVPEPMTLIPGIAAIAMAIRRRHKV